MNKTNLIRRIFGLIIIAVALFSFCCREKSKPPYQKSYSSADEYHFTKVQSTAINKLLIDSSGWRLARASDNTNPNLRNQQHDDPAYQPYFLEADLNNDGQQDFVAALIHPPDTNFAVFFFQKQGDYYAAPQLLFQSNYFNRCGLFFIRDELIAGEFFSDNAASFRWDSVQQKLVEIEYESEVD